MSAVPGEEIDDEDNERDDDQSVSFRRVALVAAICLGIFSGVGAFTFGYGEGASYLSSNPDHCANCHVMQEHLDTWQKSSHHHVAVCNDCHLPHDFVGKWWTKADNGFFHSLAFTLQNYHEPIQMKPRNQKVTQDSCIHCHQDFVHALVDDHDSSSQNRFETLSCVHCHADVGHAFRTISSASARDPE